MMEKKLIEYIKKFQLIDLLGFGNILQVEETNDFESYLTNIIIAFLQQKRKKRKQLLKLAEDIAANNEDYDKEKNNLMAENI